MRNDEPKVVVVLREYRAEIMRREAARMDEMARRWLKIEKSLDADLIALQMKMAQLAGENRVITQQMLWREERYQILKAKLQDEIKRYNVNYLVGAVSEMQGEFGWLGVEASRDAIEASFAKGLAPRFPVLNRDAVESMAGFLSNGAPLNSLLKNDYPEALQGLSEALIKGIARGSGTKTIALEMANGMGMGLDRALLIAGTESNRAYRTASTMQYRESGVVSGFRRLVSRADACMACLMLDGEHFELESELDDHPRGHCHAVPEVIGVGAPKWELGKDWFLTLSPEEQRARLGDSLFEKWSKDPFDLSDMVSKRHSDEWGASPVFRHTTAGN